MNKTTFVAFFIANDKWFDWMGKEMGGCCITYIKSGTIHILSLLYPCNLIHTTMPKEKTNKVMELENPEVDAQFTSQEQLEKKYAKEAAETLLKEKTEKLKIETMAKVVSLVDDKDRELLTKLDKIVQDAVTEAVAIGQVPGLQFADSQVGVYEVGEDPFASPMSKMIGGRLDTVLGSL